MSLHLFSTPVQCTACGTVVDDPKLDRCPKCGALLKERRTPQRLAGVEKRFGTSRFLTASLRFLAVITLLVAGLLFAFGLGGEDGQLGPGAGLIVVTLGVVVAVGMFAIAAHLDLMMSVEENTRATFRMQQMILDSLHEDHGLGSGSGSDTPEVEVPRDAVPR